MNKIKCLNIIIFLGLTIPAFAANSIIKINHNQNRYDIGKSLYLFEDPKKEFTIKDVSSPDFSKNFTISKEDVPNLAYTKSAYWFKFTLKNDSSENSEWYLVLNYALMDDFRFYIPDGKDGFIEKISGRNYPFSQKEFKSRKFVSSFNLPQGPEKTYYLRLETSDSFPVPLGVWKPKTFIEYDHDEQFYLGLYYGIIAIMILFNLFLFFSVRDVNYIYYVLILVFMHGFFQLGINGLSFEYLGQDSIWWSRTSIPFSFSISAFFFLQFVRSFLNTRKIIPLLDKFMIAIMVWAVIETIASPFIDYIYAITSTATLGQFGAGTGWLAGVIALKKGNRAARFFILAWTSLIVGGLIYSIKIFLDWDMNCI